ncbi:MAG: FAD-binding protein [Chloroflexi bacterium]|nr:FAD-binding protein [Chloroflexota bacterium]
MASLPDKWDLEVDLVAVGSSSGGLTAAIVGHDLGLKTVLLEKAATLGGGTAYSGGIIWIGANHHELEEMGIQDSKEETLTYLQRISSGRGDEKKQKAYAETGPEVLRYMEEHTPLKMIVSRMVDYRAELPGGKGVGRYLAGDPIEMGMMLTQMYPKVPLLQKVRVSPMAQTEMGGLPAQMWAGGRAFIGPLVLGCADRGIDILTETPAKQLVQDASGRVVGIRAQRLGKDFYVKANKAVVLATGGYEWNEELNRRFMHGPKIVAFTPPSNSGDGHIMGMEVGAAIALMDHSLWLPAVHIPGEMNDDKPLFRLFLGSCGKPGDILVNRKGERFCDESFYPDMGRGWVTYDSHNQEFPNAPCFHISDQAYRDKYPIATAAPGTPAPAWLSQANTLRELAGKLDIDSDGLEKTVAQFNDYAKAGKDPDFRRGEYLYDRNVSGDPSAANPCLGPISKPPFYGVEVLPATAGHEGGLVTNDKAQVINVRGDIIPGLYACSNTAAHLVCGFSYNSGLANGQSFVFGYIAARHIATGA